jgi:hypothetical protein
VAQFVEDCAPLGSGKVWDLVQEISAAHDGLADPTRSDAVSEALSAIRGIEPPHSWRKDEKREFLRLPYGMQLTLLRREDERDAALRRAQNRLANERKANGIHQNVAA